MERGAEPRAVVLAHRQHHHAHRRLLRGDPPGGLDAVQAGHLHLHHHDVGLLGLTPADGSRATLYDLSSLACQLGLVALVSVQLRSGATGTGRDRFHAAGSFASGMSDTTRFVDLSGAAGYVAAGHTCSSAAPHSASCWPCAPS